MEHNIIHTRDDGERVTSSYAEIYFDDDYCHAKVENTRGHKDVIEHENTINEDDDINWTSPSDLLVGIIELKPPFTSKITRGITHEGILAIGNEVLNKEREKFIRTVTQLIHENDSAWSNILEHEKASVAKKVKTIYENILKNKTNIMTKEISAFYEYTLRDLEDHMKTEIKTVLITAHANIISDLNAEIKSKLFKEREILEKILQKRYDSEVIKIKKYYKLLLSNELDRNRKLVNKAITERNDALRAFCKQLEAENTTSIMYVLCLERKKCRINQFIMQNYLDLELAEKVKSLKTRQEVIDTFKERDVKISIINKEWEDKIRKILELFLKFISFSLKLLPEQATFLLDLEKMVVLQLNEIQKNPKKVTSILLNEEDNVFKFEESCIEPIPCDKDPFVVAGDSSITIPPKYGSRETLAPEVDLPYIRLQRQFVYAKCHNYEQIKAFLEAERCKCLDISPKVSKSQKNVEVKDSKPVVEPPVVKKESSNELLIIDDIHRLQECPMRGCQDWAKRLSFPYLDSYLDFNEDNYEIVKTILGKRPKQDATPTLLDPKAIVRTKLPFSATTEPYHTVGTQYSSQEDLYIPDIPCSCTEEVLPPKSSKVKSTQNIKDTNKMIDAMMTKRKNSLKHLLQDHPNLLKFFTDESFDFVL